jgi:subtilisin-like proprotein convertase family protein
VNDYATKLSLAGEAGAPFAIIYNYPDGPSTACPPGEQLCPLGGTDFSPIPAVFIGSTEGTGLLALFQTNKNARARLAATGTSVTFTVTNQLSTEQVQVRLKTDHPLRGDLRITLTSPAGTRSVLQAYNADTSAGPVDWTYMSTHHFYEEARGAWTLTATDEGAGNTGSILYAALTITGVPIVDSNQDGLDDSWKQTYFGSLDVNPLDSPDGDAWTNLREFIQGSDPTRNDQPLRLDIAQWTTNQVDQVWRVSWPNNLANRSTLSLGPDAAHLSPTNEIGTPNATAVWMHYTTNADSQLFEVKQ